MNNVKTSFRVEKKEGMNFNFTWSQAIFLLVNYTYYVKAKKRPHIIMIIADDMVRESINLEFYCQKI